MTAVARADQAWPRRLPLDELVGPDGLAPLAADELLMWLLESHTVCDLALERWLTALRLALSTAVRERRSDPEPLLHLCCALARQGFLNDYTFATTPEENDLAARLRDEAAAMIAGGGPPVPLTLAATAMYGPLGALPGAEALARLALAPPLAGVVRQQVTEPLIEAVERKNIPQLTPIRSDTSQAVRHQYEESPYPRWVHPAVFLNPAPLPIELRRIFPHASLAGLAGNRDFDVLIAGCGTGHHPIEFALEFQRVRITAVDLSLSSLAFARRRTKELGISNIDYAQADLMELGGIGRSFDVVDASGVLHHLAEPLAGWRLLLGLLRPGGVMRLALYSEIARQDIVAARTWIAERGYNASPDDIRRCRHEIIAEPRFASLARIGDFYSVSECRDLLFHVQEHRFTLPTIAAFLAEHGLSFIGFMLTPPAISNYRQRFPDDRAMTRLDYWHRFETENPDTFIGMYQFWVEKAP
jgi:SAM-dependent methyltransferase